MAKGMPSLLALLGLVAVAGYQNRDKLRDMIGDAKKGRSRTLGRPIRNDGLWWLAGRNRSDVRLWNLRTELVGRTGRPCGALSHLGSGREGKLLGIGGSEQRAAAG